MDREYLQHIAGSPYSRGIEVQLESRAKTKNIVETQLNTESSYILNLYDYFMRQMEFILQDFESKLPEIKQMTLNGEQPHIIQLIDELKKLIDVDFLRTYHYQATLSPPAKGSDQHYKRGLTNFEKPSLAELAHIGLDEANINKSWNTRNAGKIIKSYLDVIGRTLKTFYATAKRYTGKNPSQVKSVLKSVNLKKEDIVKKTEDLLTLSSFSGGQATPGEIPPLIASPKPTTLPKETPPATSEPKADIKPPSEQEKTTDSQSKSEESNPTQAAPPVISPSFNYNPEDFSRILLKSVEIIIDTIESDDAHSRKFMDPTTKFSSNFGRGELQEIEDSESLEKNEPEQPLTGLFLYDFRGKYRKFPGKGFSLEMIPKNVSPDVVLSNGEIVSVEVSIYNVSMRIDFNISTTSKTGDPEKNGEGAGKVSGPQTIFRVWQTDPSPKADGANFTINSILKKANPNFPSILAKATPETIQKIKSLSEGLHSKLQRALYAITYRKTMEWKPRKMGIPHLLAKSNGDVVALDSSGKLAVKKGDLIPKSFIASLINSSNRQVAESWIEALDAIEYFENNQYGIEKPIPVLERPSVQDGIEILSSQGIENAEELAVDAWYKALQLKLPSSKISTEFIVKIAKATMNGKKYSNAEELEHDALKSEPKATSSPATPPSSPESPKDVEDLVKVSANVSFNKSTGEIFNKGVKVSPNVVQLFKLPTLKVLLSKGYPIAKFPPEIIEKLKSLIVAKKPSPKKTSSPPKRSKPKATTTKKPKGKPIKEELINPFRPENFLY